MRRIQNKRRNRSLTDDLNPITTIASTLMTPNTTPKGDNESEAVDLSKVPLIGLAAHRAGTMTFSHDELFRHDSGHGTVSSFVATGH